MADGDLVITIPASMADNVGFRQHIATALGIADPTVDADIAAAITGMLTAALAPYVTAYITEDAEAYTGSLDEEYSNAIIATALGIGWSGWEAMGNATWGVEELTGSHLILRGSLSGGDKGYKWTKIGDQPTGGITIDFQAVLDGESGNVGVCVLFRASGDLSDLSGYGVVVSGNGDKLAIVQFDGGATWFANRTEIDSDVSGTALAAGTWYRLFVGWGEAFGTQSCSASLHELSDLNTPLAELTLVGLGTDYSTGFVALADMQYSIDATDTDVLIDFVNYAPDSLGGAWAPIEL